MLSDARDQLLANHDEFRRLAQEHSHHSERLNNLSKKQYLTDEDKLEEVRLKKLKLRLKDQMELIEHEQTRANQVA